MWFLILLCFINKNAQDKIHMFAKIMKLSDFFFFKNFVFHIIAQIFVELMTIKTII